VRPEWRSRWDVGAEEEAESASRRAWRFRFLSDVPIAATEEGRTSTMRGSGCALRSSSDDEEEAEEEDGEGEARRLGVGLSFLSLLLSLASSFGCWITVPGESLERKS